MRFINFFTLLILAFILTDCSSETNEEARKEPIVPVENTRFLKRFSSTDPGFAFAQRDFEYEGDFLIQYDYDTDSNSYEYDNKGRLSTITGQGFTFYYNYNEKNELIEVSRKFNSNNTVDRYWSLKYEKNNVTIVLSEPASDFESVIVHYLDMQGKIVKIVGEGSWIGYKTKEYVYDEKGNIIKEILTNNETLEDRENIYTYHLDIINPFFVAYKELNRSNYHIENLTGIDIMTLNGTTPNVIARNGYEYTSDETNYPIKLVVSNENGAFVWQYDYY